MISHDPWFLSTVSYHKPMLSLSTVVMKQLVYQVPTHRTWTPPWFWPWRWSSMRSTTRRTPTPRVARRCRTCWKTPRVCRCPKRPARCDLERMASGGMRKSRENRGQDRTNCTESQVEQSHRPKSNAQSKLSQRGTNASYKHPYINICKLFKMN